MLLALASAASSFAAPLTCASCHRAQATNIHSTGMSNALEPVASAPILVQHPKLAFKQGPYSYTIERDGTQSIYRVTDGKHDLTLPISWAFGLGAAGQTYLIARDGKWYESRVSYYKDINGLDLTTGARPDVPRDLDEALGRELSAKGAEECFNCHSTNALANGTLHVENVTPGVQCDRCHTGAQQHLRAFQTRTAAAKTTPEKLGTLSAEDLSDYCGQCHRTWSQIAAQGPHSIVNVRFQPYRLANSKCFDATDARIRCTACHDIHSELRHEAAYYDTRCQSCHAASGGKQGAKLCPVATSNCASCHMPKVFVKETHNNFTDHWIRIARKGDPYPE